MKALRCPLGLRDSISVATFFLGSLDPQLQSAKTIRKQWPALNPHPRGREIVDHLCDLISVDVLVRSRPAQALSQRPYVGISKLFAELAHKILKRARNDHRVSSRRELTSRITVSGILNLEYVSADLPLNET